MDISAAKQDFFTPQASQKKKPGGRQGGKKTTMGYALECHNSTNPRKRPNTSQDSDQLPHRAKILKTRKITPPITMQANNLHDQIFTDLTEDPKKGRGKKIFGDFWNAFKSILDAFCNQYHGDDIPIIEENILAAWMPCKNITREKDKKLVKITWGDCYCKITTVNYFWDQAKNIVLRGLKEGENYFSYETEYKNGKKPITAWECLDIFLTQYISRKGWKVSAALLREKLTSSLKDPKPTESDKKKISIKHCDQFLKPEDIESKGLQLFGKSQWQTITKLIATSYNGYKPSLQENCTPEVHDIFHQALKDFIQIMPELPGMDEVDDLHPETGAPIRRTVATTEFNISSSANKLNSEQTFATLIYPFVHAEKYDLMRQDIEKYEFLLAAVMNLKHYYFIMVDPKNTQKEEFRNEELWKNEHKYHSIFPFLLAFKSGVSSIPSGEDPEIGEDINYDALKNCFSSENELSIVKNINMELESRLTDSEKNISNLTKEKTHLEEKIELLSSDNTEITDENKKLTDQLKNYKDEISEYRKKIQSTEEKLQEANQLLLKKEEEVKEKNTLTKENHHLAEELKLSKESAIALEGEVKSLTDTIRSLKEKLGRLEEEHKNIEEQCKKNISEICPQKKETKKNKSADKEPNNPLRSMKNMVESICLITRETRQETANLQQKLMEEKITNQKSIKEAESFRDTISDKEKKIKKLEKEIQSAREACTISRDTLLESGVKMEELKTQYQNEIKTKTKKIEELKKNHIKKISRLEEEIDNLKKQKKTNQDELKSLKQDLNKANLKLKNNDSLHKSLSNRITELSKKIKEKEKDIKEKDKDIKEKDIGLTSLKDQITEYRTNSEQLAGKVNILENNVRTLAKERELLCQLLRESSNQDEKIKLESEITHLKKELLTSKESIKVYESDLKKMKDKQESLLSELENIRYELDRKESKEREQLIKKKTLEDQLKLTEANVLESQAEVSSLKKEYERRIKAYESDLKTLKDKQNSLLSELESTRSELANKEANEREQLIEKNKLEDSLKETKARMLQLQTEVSKLKEHEERIKTYESDLKIMKDRQHSLTSELENIRSELANKEANELEQLIVKNKLEDSLKAGKASMLQLQTEVSRLKDYKELVKKYENDLKTMNDKESSLLSELEDIKSELANKESNEREQLIEKNKLIDNLKETKASILQLQTEVTSLKKHEDCLSTENKNLNTRLTEIRSDLEQSILEKESVGEDLSRAQDALTKQTELMKIIRQESSHTQNELKRTQDNFEKISAQAESSHEEICQLRDQVTSLERAKARLEYDLNQSQKNMTNYKKSIIQVSNSQFKNQEKCFIEQQTVLLNEDQQLEQVQRELICTKTLADAKCREVEELKKEMNNLKTNVPAINHTVNQQLNILQMTPDQLLDYQTGMETLLRQKDITIDLLHEMLAANAQTGKIQPGPSQLAPLNPEAVVPVGTSTNPAQVNSPTGISNETGIAFSILCQQLLQDDNPTFEPDIVHPALTSTGTESARAMATVTPQQLSMCGPGTFNSDSQWPVPGGQLSTISMSTPVQESSGSAPNTNESQYRRSTLNTSRLPFPETPSLRTPDADAPWNFGSIPSLLGITTDLDDMSSIESICNAPVPIQPALPKPRDSCPFNNNSREPVGLKHL
ncbi:hypothetical protein [Salinisphaera sp. G21_0]|uniref:hypothetical protein n=1 Tax=Salinisphaera sp. G21_0 TaxID=2821094 RepID=UPI001ADBC8B1|nr:hypothetical protein [Salinisphaera sp. G21_0]MBO9482305.1 hypothetical protein [Salinisphaera sp. G21_0]